MDNFIEEIKVDIRDLEELKDEEYNYWEKIFVHKFEKHNISSTLMNESEKRIIDELIRECTISKGKENICNNLGYDLKNRKYSREDVRQRLFLLINRIEEIISRNPNAKIETYLSRELYHIAKEIEQSSSEVKKHDINSNRKSK